MKYYCQNFEGHKPMGPTEVKKFDKFCGKCGKTLNWKAMEELYRDNPEQWDKTETIAVYPYGMDGFLRKL